MQYEPKPEQDPVQLNGQLRLSGAKHGFSPGRRASRAIPRRLRSVSPDSLAGLLLRLWDVLPARRRREVLAAMALMIVSGLSELVTMVLLVPFLVALSGPERLMAMGGMRLLAAALGADQPRQLLLPLTLLVSASALVGALLRSIALWNNGRLAAGIGHDLSVTTYASILRAEHSFLLERNSSELIGAMESIDEFVIAVFRPLLQMLSSLLIASVVGLALVLINPALAIMLAVIASVIYLVTSRVTSSRLQRVNSRLAGMQATRIRLQQESMAGIRHIRVTGSDGYFIDRYVEADGEYRLYEASGSFFSNVPRYAIEGFGIVLLCGIAFLLFSFKGAAYAIPAIGVLTLATQRFLPSVQEAYAMFSLARSRRYSLRLILEILGEAGFVGTIGNWQRTFPAPDAALIPFSKGIHFENVSFAYPDGHHVFDRISFAIPKGCRLAIVGPTGSGKSTLTDLLLGFVLPSQGRIWIDDQPLTDTGMDHRTSWQAQIAYVPQHVYLSDASVLENIAFGESPDAVDLGRIQLACEAACISDLIARLPDGLETKVGEWGGRLSGGQRQRIGIARALYQNKPILMLDEPTNSLDGDTEEAIIDSVARLPQAMTIILVTHSLSLANSLDLVLRVSAETRSVSLDSRC
jgi:ABC-type multidrug transport system fused ATPase/permease subunit